MKSVLVKILEIPSLEICSPPTDKPSQLKIVQFMDSFQLRPRDAYHLLIMQANEIEEFATFDSDFRRVFSAKALKKA